ncbi:formamidopyrimidine-DNA glycosylase [Anaerosporomusa subterranea]|uniref:Formamidopyrimidine-DNA glycosylase n=1 Tax=Anaerosporomusa subterranea TaxID=1794912 RepID=A0A154BV62_ANASB|nr:bifunctional DNA-formamidopyrimidine glycosylase/DNA-(apurinic or apyrimidinic site) lyase [Anaerosporomusa subterranea]KYZ77378.1 formamidopyrimidine-DNA glycosylase [Anaerosporomusa subterranea]
MPELPEVETVRRGLIGLAGRRIESIDIQLPRLIKWPTPSEFADLVTGKRILSIDRRGKYLLLQLEGDLALVIHLRMTGRLYLRHAAEPSDAYTRVLFFLDTGDRLVFADTRTLGTLYLMHLEELSHIHGLASMGPEPLSSEFTADYLARALNRRKAKVKSLLLNQEIIGGLGNIYVDESLSLAGIHPERTGESLNREEIERLFAAINHVIDDALSHHGTTIRDYLDSSGREGGHQHHLQVYGRKGEPCQICGSAIQRIEVGGRGTHFCPKCQQ